MKAMPQILSTAIAATLFNSSIVGNVVAEEFQLEEVIVTATKRSKSLQDVPVAVTAFTGETIRNMGMTDSSAIATQTPNLQWRSDYGTTSPNIFLRGIGNNSFHANAVGAVGVYTDGVYLNSNMAHGFQLFDLERVEVLRGPQGTLYGRNTTGGLINFIARKPSHADGLNANITTTLGSHNQRDLEFSVGAPIGDDSAVRFSAQSLKRDGLFESTIPGAKDKGQNESIAWRLLFNSQVTNQIDFTLNLHGAKNNSDNRPFKSQGVVCPGGVPLSGFGNGCTDFLGFEASEDYEKVSENINTIQDTESYGASVVVEWDMEEITLTSISAVETVKRKMLEDVDRSPANFFTGSYDAEATQYSQEIRLTSHAGGDIEWMAGLFFFKENLNQYESFALNDLGPGVLLGGATEEGVGYIAEQDTLSYSAFTEIGYHVSDKLKATLGVRWTYDERDVSEYRSIFFDPTGLDGKYVSQSVAESLGFDLVSSPIKEDWSELSGRFTLDYTFNSDIMAYYSLSRGFKGGEFNSGATFFPQEFTLADPEYLLSNEIGIKSTWLDNSLKLNAALFHYRFQDQQVFTLASGTAIPVQNLTNAGKSTIYGFEAELQYLPAEGWFIQAGLGWLDTEYKDYELVDGATSTVMNLSGNEQPGAPKVNFNSLVRYEWSLDSGASVSVQTDFVFTDDQFFTADNNPSLTEGSYWLWNARAEYSSPDGDYKIALWGKNIAGEDYITTAFDTSAFGVNSVGIGDPRTYGLTFSLQFD